MGWDLVTLSGEPCLARPMVRTLILEQGEKDLKAVIFGEGSMLAVAQMLEVTVSMRIMEKANRMPHLLHSYRIRSSSMGMPILQQLKEEQVNEADFFNAVSPDDEDNVMGFLQAVDMARIPH